MLHLPRNPKEWAIAIASALTGFFLGGAAVAAVQQMLSRLL